MFKLGNRKRVENKGFVEENNKMHWTKKVNKKRVNKRWVAEEKEKWNKQATKIDLRKRDRSEIREYMGRGEEKYRD